MLLLFFLLSTYYVQHFGLCNAFYICSINKCHLHTITTNGTSMSKSRLQHDSQVAWTLTYDIVLGAERVDHSLVPVTSEPLDDDLQEEESHCQNPTSGATRLASKLRCDPDGLFLCLSVFFSLPLLFFKPSFFSLTAYHRCAALCCDRPVTVDVALHCCCCESLFESNVSVKQLAGVLSL